MSRPVPLRDPGAQAERTLLAWTRTCLALAAVALVLVRLSVGGAVLPSVGAAVVLLAALGLSVAARRRYLVVSSGSDRPPDRLALAATVVAVAVAALCGLSVLG